jgi:hypothetical protein
MRKWDSCLACRVFILSQTRCPDLRLPQSCLAQHHLYVVAPLRLEQSRVASALAEKPRQIWDKLRGCEGELPSFNTIQVSPYEDVQGVHVHQTLMHPHSEVGTFAGSDLRRLFIDRGCLTVQFASGFTPICIAMITTIHQILI